MSVIAIAPKVGDETVNAMIELLHSEHVNIYLFKKTIKHENDFKYMVLRNEEKSIVQNGFLKCSLQKHVGSLVGLAVHYKRYVINGLHEQVRFALPETNFMFGPVHASTVYLGCQRQALTSLHFHNFQKAV